jgi:hypothetical protein
MHSILSNQRLINEINAIKDDFIQSRPHMQMSVFKATRKLDNRTNKYDNAEQPKFLRGGGSKAFQKHPLSYQPPNGGTPTPDPLFSGVVDRPVPKKERRKYNILRPITPIAEAVGLIEPDDDRPEFEGTFGPMRRYLNKKSKGGAMLKAPLPLTGECSDSESDCEGAGVLNGYSSSDDEDDYDDGAGLADTAKRAYSAMSKKSQDAIVKLAPFAKDISKKLTSPMALKIGTSGLSILFLAIASGYVGPLVSKAILPVITAKIFQIAGDVSEGVMSLATAKKEVKKVADEAKERMVESPSEERAEVTYGTTDEPEGMGLKRFGKRKVQPKGGKINKIIGTKRGESVRGAVIAEYMKKHNVSLGVASKKVKDLGLY